MINMQIENEMYIDLIRKKTNHNIHMYFNRSLSMLLNENAFYIVNTSVCLDKFT